MWSVLRLGCTLALLGSLCSSAYAAERVTLRNGFAVTCDHRQVLDAGHMRLYMDDAATSYLDVASENIVSTEPVKDLVPQSIAIVPAPGQATAAVAPGTLRDLVRLNGDAHGLNLNLLHSVIQAESGGDVYAVSRAGAQGLMQLMPDTARSLGVSDSFAADQNLRGGTAYLDALLHRYHDDLALALAAYNAGPAAVDRYHGVPPYRETQRYVARIIREFNRRTLLAQRTAAVQQADGTR